MTDEPERSALAADAATGSAPDSAVAVVGISCRLPQAADPGAFWRLLRDGVDAVSRVPAQRWAPEETAGEDVAGGPDIAAGAFLDRVDGFDAAFFGISPREAVGMDPPHADVLGDRSSLR